MKKYSFVLVCIILCSLLCMPGQVPSVSAETGDFIEPLPIEIDYPNSITFRGRLRTTVKMSDLQLIYTSNQRTCYSQVGFGMPKIVGNYSQEIGNVGDIVEWKWELTDRIGVLGSEINWAWLYSNEITNYNEEIITDSRYTWHTTESKAIVVYTAYENKQIQNEILSIAEDTLIYLGLTLEESVARKGKYRIFVYPSVEIFQKAINRPNNAGLFSSRSEATILTGFSEKEWQEERTGMKGTIAHEITHAALVDYEIFCDQKIPNWFREGYASYIENVMVPNNFITRQEFNEYLLHAQENGVLSIDEWTEMQFQDALYYSQSQYIIEYLINTFGEEKPQLVRLAVSTTKSFDTAFNEVYGFPVSELGQRFTDYMNQNLLVHQQIPPYAGSSEKSKQTDQQNESILIRPTIVPLTVQVGTDSSAVLPNNMLVIVFLGAILIAISALIVLSRIYPKNGKSINKSDKNTLQHNSIDMENNSVSSQQNLEYHQKSNGDAR